MDHRPCRRDTRIRREGRLRSRVDATQKPDADGGPEPGRDRRRNLLAVIVIYDNADHLNRTFRRANAARSGEWRPEVIWHEGEKAAADGLPAVCRTILTIVLLFGVAFVTLLFMAAVDRFGR